MKKIENKRRGSAHAALVRLSFAAIMAAVSVVLCRWLGFSPGDSMYRVEIGFLPIAVVAVLAGPLWSAASYGVADLVGSLMIGMGMNPLIFVCKILTGAIFGIFLYRRRPGITLSVIVSVVIGVWIDTLAMAGVFTLYGWAPTYAVALKVRAINAAINLPLRIALIYVLGSLGGRILDRFERMLRQ